MNIKLRHGLPSCLVGLLGLTTVWVGADAPAQAAGGSAAPRPAAAKNANAGVAKNRFVGAHPLAGNPGTGYCYIDVPHVHDYVPDRPAVYQQVGDEYVFTGDPVPFGYQGDKTVFYGHHPVPVPPPATVEVAAAPPMTFCFIKGPHYHDYAQPEAPGFKQKDNTVFYVGPIPPEVARERPQRERAVEIEYQPYVAQRPQVVVSPPPEWQGVVWSPPPPQAVTVSASAPQLLVAPPPQVVIAPPQPQVIVAPPQPQVIVAPPVMPMVVVAPPQPGVVFMPPQPHTVVIGAPAPGVVIMGGHPGGKGWKHGGGKGGWKYGGGGKGHGWRGGRRW